MSGNFAIKGGGVGLLMANAILNFHFDYLNPSLTGSSSLPPVPFQVFLAVPLCFLGVTFSLWRGLYGHLCSMLGHLLDWWCVDRPSEASGVGPVYIAILKLVI